jgi:hypothetical protein
MMHIELNLTPAQQAADDARRRQWEAEQRQRVSKMTDDEYRMARAAVVKPVRRAPPAPGPHVDTLDGPAYDRELRRLGARRPRAL